VAKKVASYIRRWKGK